MLEPFAARVLQPRQLVEDDAVEVLRVYRRDGVVVRNDDVSVRLKRRLALRWRADSNSQL